MLFALLSESLEPKRFAGLFGTAPAVALAGLAISLIDTGSHNAHESATGMLAGSGGMIAYAATAIHLLRRLRSGRAALAGLGVWFAAAGLATIPVLVT